MYAAEQEHWTQPSLFSLKGQKLNIVPSKRAERARRHRLLAVADKSSLPTLYHGSPNKIEIGGIIRPVGRDNDPDMTGRNYVFATSHPQVAVNYASPEYRTDINNNQVTRGFIYRVRPTENNQVLRDIHPHDNDNATGKRDGHYLSRQFQVLEVTHHIDENNYDTPLGNNKSINDFDRAKDRAERRDNATQDEFDFPRRRRIEEHKKKHDN